MEAVESAPNEKLSAEMLQQVGSDSGMPFPATMSVAATIGSEVVHDRELDEQDGDSILSMDDMDGSVEDVAPDSADEPEAVDSDSAVSESVEPMEEEEHVVDEVEESERRRMQLQSALMVTKMEAQDDTIEALKAELRDARSLIAELEAMIDTNPGQLADINRAGHVGMMMEHEQDVGAFTSTFEETRFDIAAIQALEQQHEQLIKDHDRALDELDEVSMANAELAELVKDLKNEIRHSARTIRDADRNITRQLKQQEGDFKVAVSELRRGHAEEIALIKREHAAVVTEMKHDLTKVKHEARSGLLSRRGPGATVIAASAGITSSPRFYSQRKKSLGHTPAALRRRSTTHSPRPTLGEAGRVPSLKELTRGARLPDHPAAAAPDLNRDRRRPEPEVPEPLMVSPPPGQGERTPEPEAIPIPPTPPVEEEEVVQSEEEAQPEEVPEAPQPVDVEVDVTSETVEPEVPRTPSPLPSLTPSPHVDIHEVATPEGQPEEPDQTQEVTEEAWDEIEVTYVQPTVPDPTHPAPEEVVEAPEVIEAEVEEPEVQEPEPQPEPVDEPVPETPEPVEEPVEPKEEPKKETKEEKKARLKLEKEEKKKARAEKKDKKPKKEKKEKKEKKDKKEKKSKDKKDKQ